MVEEFVAGGKVDAAGGELDDYDGFVTCPGSSAHDGFGGMDGWMYIRGRGGGVGKLDLKGEETKKKRERERELET